MKEIDYYGDISCDDIYNAKFIGYSNLDINNIYYCYYISNNNYLLILTETLLKYKQTTLCIYGVSKINGSYQIGSMLSQQPNIIGNIINTFYEDIHRKFNINNIEPFKGDYDTLILSHYSNLIREANLNIILDIIP